MLVGYRLRVPQGLGHRFAIAGLMSHLRAVESPQAVPSRPLRQGFVALECMFCVFAGLQFLANRAARQSGDDRPFAHIVQVYALAILVCQDVPADGRALAGPQSQKDGPQFVGGGHKSIALFRLGRPFDGVPHRPRNFNLRCGLVPFFPSALPSSVSA